MFNWTRSREMQAAQKLREAQHDYEESLAIWQQQHGTDSRDFTPAQRERYDLWIQTINAGVDFLAIAFWQHRVRECGWKP